MRKTIFAVIIVMLCSMFFVSGCSDKIPETKTHTGETTTRPTETTPQTETNKEDGVFCRILCVEDDGIFVEAAYYGYIYVKNIDATLTIAPLQTVVIRFSDSDLISASGTFTDCFGEEQAYSCILENPQSVRHTTAGEPTFG